MPAVRTMTALLTTAAALAAPSAAGARHGDGGGDGGRSGKDGGATEVRATGTCGGRVRSELRLKGDDDGIEVRLRVDHARRASTWSITAAQEGWVVWRGRRGASNGSFSLELQLHDYAGADAITLRAMDGSGVSCRVAATLPGD